MSRYHEVSGWSAAWDDPNAWHGLLAFHGVHYTRGEVWDSILENWYQQRCIWLDNDPSRPAMLYFRLGDGDAAIGIPRHSAIKALRKKGLVVVRVMLREDEMSL